MTNRKPDAPEVNTPELLACVSDEVREMVESGEVEVVPGKVGNKPVIRYSESKQWVKGVGSGQYPGAPNLGQIAKATAHKRTNQFREVLEVLTPLNEGPEVPGSVAWWHDKAMWAAAGAPQYVQCQHIGCEKKHLVAFKPDGGLIFKYIEMMGGKAPATMDIQVDATLQMLTAAMSKREVEVKVITADPDEASKRAQAIEARFSGAGDSDEGEDPASDAVIDAMFEDDLGRNDDAGPDTPYAFGDGASVDAVEGTSPASAD